MIQTIRDIVNDAFHLIEFQKLEDDYEVIITDTRDSSKPLIEYKLFIDRLEVYLWAKKNEYTLVVWDGEEEGMHVQTEHQIPFDEFELTSNICQEFIKDSDKFIIKKL